ncbi:hypothetical protein A9Q73_04855 [Bermanella sp. 47_1433_sub80_T6]|nr:hypothetical protein A9Q73_04855 [Bermanella sp. 47_1433_sub80_T6]
MTSSLIIPPRPTVLLTIQSLMAEEEVDIKAISALVKEDIALYAIFLSAVNSPWMGLVTPATSVEQAIMLLGLNRVFTLVQAVSVRNSFEGCPLQESFWTTAVDVAGICCDLANHYTGIDKNQAYSTGMLHNAGIAVMMNHHKTFKNFIKTHEFLAADELCVRERQQFSTDHFLQGAIMARKWHLGEEVALAIRYQPIAGKILKGQKTMAEGTATHLAILTLAKNISGQFRRYWLIDANSDQVVQSIQESLDYLQINHHDFSETREDLLDKYLHSSVVP